MDKISSAEFRKVYARLRRPTLVTVNGHPVGLWTPGGELDPVDLLIIQREENKSAERVLTDGRLIDRTRSFNSKPFTPAPKTKGKP